MVTGLRKVLHREPVPVNTGRVRIVRHDESSLGRCSCPRLLAILPECILLCPVGLVGLAFHEGRDAEAFKERHTEQPKRTSRSKIRATAKNLRVVRYGTFRATAKKSIWAMRNVSRAPRRRPKIDAKHRATAENMQKTLCGALRGDDGGMGRLFPPTRKKVVPLRTSSFGPTPPRRGASALSPPSRHPPPSASQ